MAMTWSGVFRNCEPKRIRRADTEVAIKQLKLGVGRNPKVPTAGAKVHSLDKINGRYKRNVYVCVAKWLNQRGHVHLSCSCPDFMYTWEVALTRKGASSIKYSNGDLPVDRNPRGTPGACIAKGEFVATERGEIKIEDVTTDDRVWTLLGWQRVLDAALTRKDVPIKRTAFVDGSYIRTTADHKVLCTTFREIEAPGWVAVRDLDPSSYVCSGFQTGDRTTKSACHKHGEPLSCITFSWSDAVPSDARQYHAPLSDFLHFLGSDVIFDRVLSVGDDGKSDVYDLTVDNAHHYFVNGKLVHNCKHLIHLMDHMEDTGLAKKALKYFDK